MQILLVEDDPQTARMVRFYLEQEGWTVIGAGEGSAGEAAFHRERPQLVILDIMLPALRQVQGQPLMAWNYAGGFASTRPYLS